MDDIGTRIKKFMTFIVDSGATDHLIDQKDDAVRAYAEKNELKGVHEAYKRPFDFDATELHNFLQTIKAITTYADENSRMKDVFPEEAEKAEKVASLYRSFSEEEQQAFAVFHTMAFFELWDAYRELNNQLHAVEIDDSNLSRLRSVLLAVNDEHAVDEIARLYGGECLEPASTIEHSQSLKDVQAQTDGLSWTPTYEMLKKIKQQLHERAQDAALSSKPIKTRQKPGQSFGS